MAVAVAVVGAGAVSGGELAEIVRIIYRAVDVAPAGIGRCCKLHGEWTKAGAGGMSKRSSFNRMIGVTLAADNSAVTIILSVFSLVFSVRWRSVVTEGAIAGRGLVAGGCESRTAPLRRDLSEMAVDIGTASRAGSR